MKKQKFLCEKLLKSFESDAEEDREKAIEDKGRSMTNTDSASVSDADAAVIKDLSHL